MDFLDALKIRYSTKEFNQLKIKQETVYLLMIKD